MENQAGLTKAHHSSGISHHLQVNRGSNHDPQRAQRDKSARRRTTSVITEGIWNLDEDVRFMNFMLQNRASFENKSLRRANKIFKNMSKFVKTRCPEQCRSHHQKYEKKLILFDHIIDCISKKISSHQGQQNSKRTSSGGKGKKEIMTMPSLSDLNFSPYAEQQNVYRILVADEPHLEIKVFFDPDRCEQYELGL